MNRSTYACFGLPLVVMIFGGWPLASASPPADVIVEDVNIDQYTHVHQDLLHTFMGDNRGFGAEHDSARDDIFDELSSYTQLNVELAPFLYAGNTYHNVVATQTGTDFPDEIYVVGAHFDSVNNPGADDNATGTALVIEAARVLSRYRSPRTIKFCCFDREEQGLRGSKAFVQDHAGQNIVMAVTADMVGHDSGAYGMDFYSKSTSATVANGLGDALDAYGQGLARFMNVGNFGFSDHWPFELAGIPAVVVIERCYSCNPHYHQNTDAVDNPAYPEGDYIDYTMPANLTRAFVGYLVDTLGITLWHDADNDADVDMADFAAFQRCFNKPADTGCTVFDFDRDGVVSIVDMDAFIDGVTGPAGPAAAGQNAPAPKWTGDRAAGATSGPRETIVYVENGLVANPRFTHEFCALRDH